MITKERLKELIKQGATIYQIRDNMIVDYQLCSYNYLEDNDLIYENVMTNYCRRWIGKLDDLFETEEDAEWELEFGNITRTETLKLPSWKEFELLGHNADFIGKDNTPYYFRFNYNKSEIYIVNMINGKEIYYARPTKENYIEACKLCKKLFLGEEI